MQTLDGLAARDSSLIRREIARAGGTQLLLGELESRLKATDTNLPALLSCVQDLQDNRCQGEAQLARSLEAAWAALECEHRRQVADWLAERPSLLRAMTRETASGIAQALNDSLSFDSSDPAIVQKAKAVDQVCKWLRFTPVPNRVALYKFVSNVRRGSLSNFKKLQAAWAELDNGLDPTIRKRIVGATMAPLLAMCRNHADHWSVLIWSSHVSTIDFVAEHYAEVIRSDDAVNMPPEASAALALATLASKPDNSAPARLALVAERELDAWLHRLRANAFQSVGRCIARNAKIVPPDQLILWDRRFARIDQQRSSVLRKIFRLLGLSRTAGSDL